MPSFYSSAPTEKPGSSLCTMNADMPRAPAAASVTAMTVYHVDRPPLVI